MGFTANQGYPLPVATNDVSADVLLLQMAYAGIDTDIYGLLNAVAGKAASLHGHNIADITLLQQALDGKSATSHAHVLNDLSDVNIPVAPANNYLVAWDTATSKWVARSGVSALGAHQHAIGDVTDLTTQLAAKAPLANAALTGVPTAPTAAPGTNTTQIANMAAVQAAIASLVASSPAALDTLNELAVALGNDPNFATTMTNALAAKADTSSLGNAASRNITTSTVAPSGGVDGDIWFQV